MAVDFQQVRQQVRRLGENAPARAQELASRLELARGLLRAQQAGQEALRKKAQAVVQLYDSGLRCAMPTGEPIDGNFPLPPLPARASVLAADGSQIFPDRHAEVEFGLINVGVIGVRYGAPEPPRASVESRLMYDQELYTGSGKISEALLALRRDLAERRMLAELAAREDPPAVTFTDGLLEIWGPRTTDEEELSEFQKSQGEYLEILALQREMGVVTAGYVDKPATRQVVRLLEVALIPEAELAGIKARYPLRGVDDLGLFRPLLGAGERSALFSVQSPSTNVYSGELALHFFFLNVGLPGRPWLARVELPAWVAEEREKLNALHAVLVDQCRKMGARPYPYLLHRAHETARVSFPEREEVAQMIAAELRRRGVKVEEISSKQAAKIAGGRTSYQR